MVINFMNKNIFLSILFILCLVAMIVVISIISSLPHEESSHTIYEGVENTDYREDFTLNGYSHATVSEQNIKSYYEFNAIVKEKEGANFINSVEVDSTALAIGDVLSGGDELGKKDEEVVKCNAAGLVLDIEQIAEGVKIIYSDETALEFFIEFSQTQIHLVSYNMKVEIDVGNGDFISAEVLKIDYEGMQDSKLIVNYGVQNSKLYFYPGYSLSARIEKENLGKQLCIPVSFFENYNLIANKTFDVYTVTNENEIRKVMIKTGNVYGNNVIILGDSVSYGQTIYIK